MGRWTSIAGTLVLTTGLTACLQAPVAPVPVPPARPAVLKPVTPTAPQTPSATSLALENYYRRFQEKQLTRGLMRTDGGGPDTQFGVQDLVRNMKRIAFNAEYQAGTTVTTAPRELQPLSRWIDPVRIAAHYGKSASAEQRAKFNSELTHFANRLARITGHPVSVTSEQPNFHVFLVNDDERKAIGPEITRIAPNTSPPWVSFITEMKRTTHCSALTYTAERNAFEIARSIVLIRLEHPDLQRLSCIHEELAQGLGLLSDSGSARPSIFNDDDEFALLTTHDEMLLKMLYDPRLQPGMTFDQARPIVKTIAQELTGGS